MRASCVEQDEFVALMPMSNWLRGFDRYQGVWSKAKLPGIKHERLYMMRRGEPLEPAIKKAQDLASRLGEAGQIAWIKARLPVGIGRMEPNRWTGTGIGWGWPEQQVIVAACGALEQGELVEMSREELTAKAFEAGRRGGQLDWAGMSPRSFSALPIAKACQASCRFCFSKASVSEAIEASRWEASQESLRAWARLAERRGASRAVITGGGEPTLMRPDDLRSLTRDLAERFKTVLMISNGARWAKLTQGELESELQAMRGAGLTRLAISRHGWDQDSDEAVMGLRVESGKVLGQAKKEGIKARVICVTQKGGIDSPQKVIAALARNAREGIEEMCFKELYVSSVRESAWAKSPENVFAESHQVSLSMCLDTLMEEGFERAGELPWGSPVLKGRFEGTPMTVALYSEPSVGWEMSRAMCRSWNWMSDGDCLASLEDAASRLSLSDQESRAGAGR